jgi:hypothetical protein
MLEGTDRNPRRTRMPTLTRIASVVAPLALLAGCATGGHPTPDAIYRNAATADVQWCDKPSGVGMALGGAFAGAVQGADYASCKSSWESKGYVRMDSMAKLSPDDQRRYEADRAQKDKALADSIRKN